MNKLLFTWIVSILFCCLTSHTYSQVIAGVIPSAGQMNNTVINLALSTCAVDTSISIDMDCDNIMDLTFRLHKGITAIDAENYVVLKVPNGNVEICDTSWAFVDNKVIYFNSGDTLITSSNTQWSLDSIYSMGSWGGLGSTGPSVISNKYIAYRMNGQVGWVNLTFNLLDGNNCSIPISISINSFISYCSPLSGGSHLFNNSKFCIYPNPSYNNVTLNAKNAFENASVKIFNMVGQCIKKLNHIYGNTLGINLEFFPDGVYFIHVEQDGILLQIMKLKIEN